MVLYLDASRPFMVCWSVCLSKWFGLFQVDIKRFPITFLTLKVKGQGQDAKMAKIPKSFFFAITPQQIVRFTPLQIPHFANSSEDNVCYVILVVVVMVPFKSLRCGILFAFYSNYGAILYRLRDITTY